MNSAKPKQVIQVGGHMVSLPEGVTALEWALERVNYQNPRIRAFLGCIRLLDGVMESNYAILHCSPERLLDIWRKVRQVAELIRHRISPLLEVPSRMPVLEEARQSAETSLGMLDYQVLRRLDGFPEDVPPDQLLEVRKLLCISIGQIHAFLVDTFGELMAKDPRSLHDSDYFLSRRFPQDIEEAEWLHATLVRLGEYMHKLDEARTLHMTAMAERMRNEESVPTRHGWAETRAFLDVLLAGLTPKLKEVLALRGVRFYEMEILDRLAFDIPSKCRTALEIHEVASEAIDDLKRTVGGSREERTQNVQDLLHLHAAFSRRLASLVTDVDKALQDLVAFIPLWLEGVEKRRALLLKRELGQQQARAEEMEALGAKAKRA
ncbi:MAG TPA: hypothetical protein VN493_16440 [Thermoanaerobaculia bacterium]|nr:hypothetical protein [Thermoanaerobaculia bacterium]